LKKILKEEEIKNDFEFFITCTNFEKSMYGNLMEFVFDVVFKNKNNNKVNNLVLKWRVNKTITQIKNFNTDLESYLNTSVHYYSKLMQ
jgi:hypothetical protein